MAVGGTTEYDHRAHDAARYDRAFVHRSINVSRSVYGFEIDDPSAAAITGLANQPLVNWVIGVPSSRDPSTALQHGVHDCSAEPGETLRIFGKNFNQSSQVVLQSSTGAIYLLTPSKADTNSIAAQVPSAMLPGAYYLWVGSSPWSPTSSPATPIAIISAPSFDVRSATCSALVGDGATDNTTLLQSCLDKNAPNPSSNQLVYLTIPSGTFVIKGEITLHPYEIIVGSSPTLTTILGLPKRSPPSAWFSVPQYVGLANLTFKAPANPSLLAATDPSGNPTTSGHIFVDDVDFESTADLSQGAEHMFALSGPDIQVYNSIFSSDSFMNLSIEEGDGAILSGNQFSNGSSTNIFNDSQNIIAEMNTMTSKNSPGTDKAGAAFDISRSFSSFGPSHLSRNIYIGYNTLQNLGGPQQPVITTDGGGGAYYGDVASSTTDTVVLADQPSWQWVGTTNPEAAMIVRLWDRCGAVFKDTELQRPDDQSSDPLEGEPGLDIDRCNYCLRPQPDDCS